MDDIKKIIDRLQLQPHPEGGYFRETYRSTGTIPKEILGKDYTSMRNYSTGIYFLITSESFSAFHKIRQDEMWHFYQGSAMILHMISPEGKYSSVHIGNDLDADEVPQFTVPGGYWFASEVLKKASFSLLGCTVAPGFDFEDFEMPSRKELEHLFPQHKEVITKLTHT